MSTNNPQDNPLRSLTDKIRNWFERTPRAQRAYEKLSADLDTVVSKVESVVDESDTLRDLRTKVGAAIDPPTTRPDAAVDAPATAPPVDAGASPPPPVAAEMSPPPPPTSSLPTSSALPTSSTLPTPSSVEPPASSPASPPAPSTTDPTSGIEARRLPGSDAQP